MGSYKQLIAENRRLVILKALEQDPGYSHNEEVLRGVLKMAGHTISRDTLRMELSWLAEQDLVRADYVEDILTARLTVRGQDVANGSAQVPGVKRPGPGDC